MAGKLATWQRFARFVCVGALAALVDLGGLQLLVWLGSGPLVARAISLPLAMLTAWQLNRHFTFGASARHPAEEAARYACVASAATGVNYLLFAGLMTWQPGFWPPLAGACGIGVSMWISWFGLKAIAFGRARPLAD